MEGWGVPTGSVASKLNQKHLVPPTPLLNLDFVISVVLLLQLKDGHPPSNFDLSLICRQRRSVCRPDGLLVTWGVTFPIDASPLISFHAVIISLPTDRQMHVSLWQAKLGVSEAFS